MKNTQSKLKLIKTGKKVEERIVWSVNTNNFEPQEIKMTNKVLREKSNCVICWSSKSSFLKQKHNSEK